MESYIEYFDLCLPLVRKGGIIGVVSYGTLGKDKYWKRKILEQISDGDSFLDLACGTGILTREIAEKFPSAKIVGIDITKSYLDVAKKNS